MKAVPKRLQSLAEDLSKALNITIKEPLMAKVPQETCMIYIQMKVTLISPVKSNLAVLSLDLGGCLIT